MLRGIEFFLWHGFSIVAVALVVAALLVGMYANDTPAKQDASIPRSWPQRSTERKLVPCAGRLEMQVKGGIICWDESRGVFKRYVVEER